ncbi:protoporphyrinogen oxidase HemJ [Acidocella sp.]|jgi:putative membrane protein|uniref:protoporphyrinogen oxidase HemJ n=1 Tax=Acidocella sp. TaxID=50710 RepID=UPI00260E97E4|nr:protoporphyrinogen oxidase HemJ [Acidocella sp.]
MTVLALVPWFHWFLAFHIMSFTAWMAGMFYLPRLFVYHCQTRPGTEESERFKVMEVKLLRFIINPAMISTWAFGILLALTPGTVSWSAPWWWTKLAALLGMQLFHAYCAFTRKQFLADRRPHTEKFYRALNEVPTVLFIIIVLAVVVWRTA